MKSLHPWWLIVSRSRAECNIFEDPFPAMLRAFCHFWKVMEAVGYELRFSEWGLKTGIGVYHLVRD